MEAPPARKIPMFNRCKLICGVMACLCYASSLGCFYVHTLRKNLAWKLPVGITIYVLPVVFAVVIGFQKLGYIGRDKLRVIGEPSRIGNLFGPILAIWVLPLLEGEYTDPALFAALLGSASFANILMFIAPINTDFGLLNLLCGSAVKLSWENEKADLFVWVRTGSACTVIIIVRYLVNRAVRMRIANEVQAR